MRVWLHSIQDMIIDAVYGWVKAARHGTRRDFGKLTIAYAVLATSLVSMWGSGTALFGQKTAEKKGSMVQLDTAFILAQLANCEKTGRLGGLEIEFWTGGGQPPPYYRSDQFRLLTSDGNDLLQFTTIKWDKRYDPPDLHEKFLLQAVPSDIESVARLLRETGVFVKRFPEEEKPGIADVLSTEIIVSAAGRQEKRVYYLGLPDKLVPLREQIEKLIELTKSKGKKEVYHQGKPVLSTDSNSGKSEAEALVKQSWEAIQKTELGAEKHSSGSLREPAGWRYAITPPFPCKWPPDGRGEVCYYAFARGLKPGLLDAEVVSTLWGRVLLDTRGEKPPRMDILSRALGESGIQGVRPLAPQEMAIYRTAETAELAVQDLVKTTQPETFQAGAIRLYYCQWSKDNGVVSGQVRVLHEGFFRWLDCAGAQSGTKVGLWKDTFVPYPGARLLCGQAVDDFRSGVGITWFAYVTGDPPEKVMDFYIQKEGKEHVEIKEDSFQIRRGNTSLSVHRASSRDYPRCREAPGPGDNTVIVVS